MTATLQKGDALFVLLMVQTKIFAKGQSRPHDGLLFGAFMNKTFLDKVQIR